MSAEPDNQETPAATWPGVNGKRILFTGATNGIGLAGAQELSRRGARLAIVARDRARAADAAALIAKASPSGESPDILIADLSSMSQVRELAQQALERYPTIDVLINNAGAIFTKRQLSPDGFELTWALNHLAPFLLTSLLLDRLCASAPARIIVTASDAHRGAHIPFDDINAEQGYRRAGIERYSQSKLANILFTAELARRIEGSGVTANCLHPGVVATGFGRNNGAVMGAVLAVAKPFMRSPERGARTLVWLADSPDLDGVSGGYFADEKPGKRTSAARDADAAGRLWELSERQVAS